MAAKNAAHHYRMSTVMGHLHGVFGVNYTNNCLRGLKTSQFKYMEYTHDERNTRNNLFL